MIRGFAGHKTRTRRRGEEPDRATQRRRDPGHRGRSLRGAVELERAVPRQSFKDTIGQRIRIIFKGRMLQVERHRVTIAANKAREVVLVVQELAALQRGQEMRSRTGRTDTLE